MDYTKPVILVEDQMTNNQTSLTLLGRNYAGYSQIISENFVHLLENFAHSVSPSNPIEGQLWYDNSSSMPGIKYYTGAAWKTVGGISKNTTPPRDAALGDLWVDLVTLQVKMFSGSTWELVGPYTSSTGNTGVKPETLTDISAVTHDIVSIYSSATRVAIISDTAFIPNGYVAGFTSIGCGVTLSSGINAKFIGTSSKTDGLVDGNTVLTANSIMQIDRENTTLYGLNVKHNSGIAVGGELGFVLSVSSSANEIGSLLNDVPLDIKVRTNNEATILTRFDATNKRVGFGTTTPLELVHIAGNTYVDGKIRTVSTLDDSITTAGGLYVGKIVHVIGDTTLGGPLYIGAMSGEGVPIAEAIMPIETNVYDQGSPLFRYRNIYAATFVGDRFVGDLEGNLLGVAQSASTLTSPTGFSVAGDIMSEEVIFNGAQSQIVLNTVLSNNVIAGKELTTVSYDNDRVLVFRNAGGDVGLRSMYKSTFVSQLALVPIGTILAFAGNTPPSGYVFCDGVELTIADYAELFSVIGYSYKAPELLSGPDVFAVPYLNGRVPVGRDDMGGHSAHVITAASGSTLGGIGGAESVTLVEGNIPSHHHEIDSFTAEFDFASGTGVAALVRSADTEETSAVGAGTSFGVLPPYQVVNYIIYTGVL